MLNKLWLLLLLVLASTGLEIQERIVEVPVIVEKIVYKTEIVEIEWQVYEVTAYTAGFESTGKTPNHPEYGITASGQRVIPMWTIACPRELPFGTLIYIAEVQWIFSCQDRGSAITSGHLDIYMEDLERALEFGRQQLHIFILPPFKEDIQ